MCTSNQGIRAHLFHIVIFKLLFKGSPQAIEVVTTYQSWHMWWGLLGGIARAFKGERLALLEGQNEESNLRKQRKKWWKFEQKWGKCNPYPELWGWLRPWGYLTPALKEHKKSQSHIICTHGPNMLLCQHSGIKHKAPIFYLRLCWYSKLLYNRFIHKYIPPLCY